MASLIGVRVLGDEMATLRQNISGIGAPRARRWLRTTLVAAGVAVAGMAMTACDAGNSLYVDQASTNCSDAGSGTSSQPFCTITKAATVAGPGKTVFVFSGTYGGDIAVSQSGTSDAPITFESVGSDVAVVGGLNGFKVSDKSWVTIKGFTVRNSSSYGIYLKNASHVTLDGNEVMAAGQQASGMTSAGIKLQTTTSSVVTNNKTHDNSDHGIFLTAASTGNQISANESYRNARGISRAAAGFFFSGSSGNSISGNVSHDNEDSGISLWNGANNNVVVNNVIYGNGDHGIDMLTATGETVVANTVYRSVDSGIELQGNAGANLANNISVDNGIASPRTSGNIRVVDSGSASQVTLDYDLVNLSSGNILIDYLGTKYSSLAAFRAATGHEAHGLQADPRFANGAGGNFALTAGSPAIDSANSGAPAQPSADIRGQDRVDDPATPNTGVGPRAYDDRGAYEFVS